MELRLVATLACRDALRAPVGLRAGARRHGVMRAFNGEFDREIFDAQPPGVVLDAACGTGRFTEQLAKAGHRVIGVDSSPDMLVRARERAPAAELRVGDLHDLPLDDGEAGAVVCALALVHMADLAPVLAEFARVLRPGGHLVISDVHHELVSWGSIPKVVGPEGERARIATCRHRPGDYVRAGLPLGFQVRRCEEPRFQARRDDGDRQPRPMPDAFDVGPWTEWPWSLAALVPAAAKVAGEGMPSLIIWHFQLAGG